MDVPLPVGLQQISSLACHTRRTPITSSSTSHASSVASPTVPQLVVPSPSTLQFGSNVPFPTECLLREMCAQVYNQQHNQHQHQHHHHRQLGTASNGNDLQSPINLSTGVAPSPTNPSSHPTSAFDPTSLYLAAVAQLIVRQLVAQATSSSPSPGNELPSVPTPPPLAFLPDTVSGGRLAALQHHQPGIPWSTMAPHSHNPASQSPIDMTSGVTAVTKSQASPSGCLPKSGSIAVTCDANGGLREKRYQCNYPGCTKAYYKRSHLNEHSHLHTGLKPHLCAQPGCGARFTRADQLSRHRRAHTGERNFYCGVCQKRFKRSDHLKVHVARNVCTKSTT